MIFLLLLVLFINIGILVYEIKYGSIRIKSNYNHYRNESKKSKEDLIIQKRNKQNQIRNYIRFSSPIVVVVTVISFFVFRNVLISLIAGSLSFYYPRYRMSRNDNHRKEILTYQFREMLLNISNSLKAGASLQVAIERCKSDLDEIYKNQIEKPIIDELEIIVYDLKIGKSIEEALTEFGDRVNSEDVTSFVNAAIITNKTGGNLNEVMNNVARIIGDKIQIKREINTLTAAKRSEAKLLTFMPMVLVVILIVISPSYLAPMFDRFLGKILMLVGIVLIIINYYIGKRIVDIDV